MTIALSPVGLRALLEQSLCIVSKDKKDNAFDFIKLITISPSTLRCSRYYQIFSMGIRCFGNYDFRLFISGPREFNQGLKNVISFPNMSFDRARKLICLVNPANFVTKFEDEFWWNINSDLLNYVVGAPIDMLCAVDLGRGLHYQMTPFWQRQLRTLKVHCTRGPEYFVRGLVQITDANSEFVNYTGPDKSSTIDCVEVDNLHLDQLEGFVSTLKPRVTTLKTLKIDCLVVNSVSLNSRRIIEGAIADHRKALAIKKLCKAWVSKIELNVTVTYWINEISAFDSFAVSLKGCEQFKDSTCQQNEKAGFFEWIFKTSSRDDVLALNLKLLVCRLKNLAPHVLQFGQPQVALHFE